MSQDMLDREIKTSKIVIVALVVLGLSLPFQLWSVMGTSIPPYGIFVPRLGLLPEVAIRSVLAVVSLWLAWAISKKSPFAKTLGLIFTAALFAFSLAESILGYTKAVALAQRYAAVTILLGAIIATFIFTWYFTVRYPKIQKDA